MKSKYEQSSAVGILRLYAVFAGIVGLILLLVAGEERNLGDRELELLAGSWAVSSALFCFLFSMVLDALMRSAFYAEQTARLLERVAAGVNQPPPFPSINPAMPFAPPITPVRSGRFYLLLPGGDQRGPLESTDIQKLLNAGAVSQDTPAMREGEDEWKTLGAFIAGIPA
jgi:hypothetical protein